MSSSNIILYAVAMPFTCLVFALLFFKYYLRSWYYRKAKELRQELHRRDITVQQLTADLQRKEADFHVREASFFLREAEFMMKESAFVEKEKEFERTYNSMERVIHIQEKTIQQIIRKNSDDEDHPGLFGW